MCLFSLTHWFLVTTVVLLTHKDLETHGCVLSTVATDALVLEHQAIGTHSAS